MLERKSAALLAFLALHGSASRSQLSGLLWPESPEATARNNLSQTIRRLKGGCGGSELFLPGELLALVPQWQIDVKQLEMHHLQGEHEQVADCNVELLSGLYYDDCPEFSRWLDSYRERLLRLKQRSLVLLLEQRQQAGEHRAALALAQRLVELEPLSDESWRHLIQTHLQMGDRAAAINAYQRYRALLQQELNVKPMPQLTALVERISTDDYLPPPPREVPALVSHPPRLLGREALWQRMELAWQRHQAIFLCGPAGAGKTRLAREFLASKGRYYAFEARPSDYAIPYATHARTYREMLRAFSSLVLPDWVRRELMRLLPELGESPGPLANVEDKLRFYQAKAEATRLAVEAGMQRVLVDDLHFVDSASLEAGNFVYAQHWGRAEGMHTVICLREDLLEPAVKQSLQSALGTGVAVLLPLPPLDGDAFAALLASMDIDPASGCEALWQRCGGYPGPLVQLASAVHLAGADPTLPFVTQMLNQS